jgi:hypothetical protein
MGAPFGGIRTNATKVESVKFKEPLNNKAL